METATLTTGPSPSPTAARSAAADRGMIYHFLELALAHPGEDGFDYFRREETADALHRVLAGLPDGPRLAADAGPALARFFEGLRGNSYGDVEAAHIALFSANFPQVPCPPWGSLFTCDDDGKRLEEMLAIKQFYQQNGVDISETFDDLPDHICVELEFLHLLCFREDEALEHGEGDLAAALCERQAAFLDRFMLPFVERLATLALRLAPHNPYSHLLDATHRLLAHHRSQCRECLP